MALQLRVVPRALQQQQQAGGAPHALRPGLQPRHRPQQRPSAPWVPPAYPWLPPARRPVPQGASPSLAPLLGHLDACEERLQAPERSQAAARRGVDWDCRKHAPSGRAGGCHGLQVGLQ